MAKTVFSGLVTACRLAGIPTRICPSLVKATTEGVVRMPSGFSITLAWPPSIVATQEYVVPRSMPIAFAAMSPLSPMSIRAAVDVVHPLRVRIWIAHAARPDLAQIARAWGRRSRTDADHGRCPAAAFQWAERRAG